MYCIYFNKTFYKLIFYNFLKLCKLNKKIAIVHKIFLYKIYKKLILKHLKNKPISQH